MSSITDPVEKILCSAMIQLLINNPFYGSLASRFELVENNDWCKTAATDGRNIYYNREFIASLKKEEIIFLLGHEILHCVYDHLGRRGGRDPKLWNMAVDYIVNYTLTKERIGKMPQGGLYDPKFTDEMISEEVYNILKKNQPQIKVSLDQHLDVQGDSGNDDDEGEGGASPGDKDGNGSSAPKLTQEQLQEVSNEIKSAVLIAAKSAGAGAVPAGIKRMIDELISPKMDWRQLLAMQIKSLIKDDYTFENPSRRSWNEDCEMPIFLPSQKNMETIDIAIAIDTSGSITNKMVHEFLSEVKGIMDCFKDFRIILWTFDGKVHNPMVFTQSNLHEILSYEAKGGGGTLFEENWKFMKDTHKYGFKNVPQLPTKIEPKKFVMFTDGYPCGSWGDEKYCETLFIIHGPKSIKPPFGLHAHYEFKNDVY